MRRTNRPMIAKNQFNIEPGVYEHYKGGLYVVETILTHMKNEEGGDWIKLQDPLVIYRNLEAQVESINGVSKYVIKTYARKLSNFTGTVVVDEKTIKRFKDA